MAGESGIYTKDQLEQIDKQLSYMVYGQGFTVCVVDTRHTRRRTLMNTLKKIGVESFVEADNYDKTLTVLSEHPDDKILIITDIDLGKINGLRLLTGLMLKHKGLCGVILIDEPNKKLEHVAAVTKNIDVKCRPIQEEDIIKSIEGFGFSLETP